GGNQVAPVIDLVAPDQEAQTAALRRGVLPVPEPPSGPSLPLSPWLWVMGAGVALALIGLVLRGRVRPPLAGSVSEPVADEADAETPADTPAGTATDQPDDPAVSEELEIVGGAGVPDGPEAPKAPEAVDA